MFAKIVVGLLEWVITIVVFVGVSALVTLLVMMGFVTVGVVFGLSLPYREILIFAGGTVFILLVILTILKKRKMSSII